jgi:hypothetical protein
METNLDSGSGMKMSFHISGSLVSLYGLNILKYPDPQVCHVDIGPCYYYAKNSTGNATYTVLYFIPTVYRSQKLRSDQIMISNHVSTFFYIF